MIKQFLKDKKPHHVTEIKDIDCNLNTLEEALEYLIDEEIVYMMNGYISL